MKIKSQTQLMWWALLAGLVIATLIFLFAPIGLVSRFIGDLSPDGSGWIGIFYSLGLSLAILTMSGLSFVKGMMRFKIGLGVLSFAEGAISLAAFWSEAQKQNKTDDIAFIGLIGVVVIQEVVIFLCGSAIFAVINQLRTFSTPSKAVTKTVKNAKQNDSDNDTDNGSSGRGKSGFLSVPGCANMPVEKIMSEYGVSDRTAWRWKREAKEKQG